MVACPECNREDMVQKVRAILGAKSYSCTEGGVLGSTFVDGKMVPTIGHISQTISTSSELIRSLELIPQPNDPLIRPVSPSNLQPPRKPLLMWSKNIAERYKKKCAEHEELKRFCKKEKARWDSLRPTPVQR